MKSAVLHKIWDIFSYILLTAFILGGTIFAYYYANGYRFNPISGQVKQTGVLNVQAVPSKVNISVNNQETGKSPKVVSVDQGKALVKITKEGYLDWEKEVPIIAEKSTSISPTLFLQNPQAENIYSTSGKVIYQTTSPNQDAIYALILTGSEYKFIRYDLNKRFWNLSDNPQLVFLDDNGRIKNISVDISKDGKYALIKKAYDNKDTSYAIVRLNTPFQVTNETGLEEFSKDYTITWSNDSNFLILESKADLISYRISDGTKYLLLKKNPKIPYIWNTDSENHFYYTSLEKSEEGNKFSLIQTTLQGNGKKTILKDVYFHTTLEKTLDTNALTFSSLTNTKDEENFMGELANFEVVNSSNGVFMVTSKATYWYNQEDNKYTLIHPNASKYISVSPDKQKVIFLDTTTKEYFVYTFKIIEEDPTTKIGSYKIASGDKISDLMWSYDSQNIFYTQDKYIYVTNYDGTNNHKLIEYSGSFGFSNDLQFLYTISITKEKDTLEIIRYKMY